MTPMPPNVAQVAIVRRSGMRTSAWLVTTSLPTCTGGGPVTWTKLGDEFGDECWTLSDKAFRLHTEGLLCRTES